jgi:hypothetical protein
VPIHELLAILTPPLTVSRGPILLLLGVCKAWQTLSGDEDVSSVPCWAEGDDRQW